MNFGKDDLVTLKEMKDESLNGSDAVITEIYTNDAGTNYGLFIDGHGEFAWVHENNMELIERNRADLVEEWKIDLDLE